MPDLAPSFPGSGGEFFNLGVIITAAEIKATLEQFATFAEDLKK
jgi:hypothetical protein